MNSSPIRFAGIVSGMDTQSMVMQLMRAESMRMNRLTQRRQVLQWRQEDFRRTMTHMNEFRTLNTDYSKPKSILNMNSDSPWITMFANTINTGGSTSGDLKITTTNEAKAGSYSLEVKQTAQSAFVRGSAPFKGTASSNSMYDAAVLDVAAGKIGDISTKSAFTENVLNLGTKPNPNAGARHTVTMPGNIVNGNTDVQILAMSVGDIMGGSTGATYDIDINGTVITIDDGDTLGQALDKLRIGTGEDVKFSVINGRLSIFSDDPFTLEDSTPGFFDKLNVKFTGGNPLTVAANPATINDTLAHGSITINGTVIFVDENDTIKDVMKRVNESAAGVTMAFDELRGVFTITQKKTGQAAQIQTDGSGVGAAILDYMGLNGLKTSTNATHTINYTGGPTGNINLSKPIWENMGLGASNTSAFYSLTFTDTDTGSSKVVSFIGSESTQGVFDRIYEETGVKMSIANGKLSMTSEKAFTVEDTAMSTSAVNSNFLTTLGVASGLINVPLTDPASDGRVVRSGRDAIIYYDGDVEMRQTSNIFEIDGLVIDIGGATGEIENATTGLVERQKFTINVSQNVDAAVDMIKEFVENYNNLIRYLNTLHSTARPRAGNSKTGKLYEPLTDEQRQSMSDRDIEKWEEQARVGMLHNDRDIRNIQNDIRALMFNPVVLSRDKYGAVTDQISLFQVGIDTVGMNGMPGDRLTGVLEIDETALRKALMEDPERVRQLFARTHGDARDNVNHAGAEGNINVDIKMSGQQNIKQARTNSPYLGLGFRLDEFLNTTSNSTDSPIRLRAGGNTGLDVSNNSLTRQINDYNQRIDDMQKYLIRRENHYYSLFARMEQAMAKSNSQMDSLFAFGNSGM